jgi:hypothetical protein
MRLRSPYFYLACILMLSFVLRIYGVNYGLPYAYILDETFVINHSLAFGTGDLNPHFFEWPGSLLMYCLFGLYGVYFVFGSLAGLFGSADEFAIRILSNPTDIYLIGRSFTVLLSTATVYWTYVTGTRYYNRSTGLIAALFLAASPLASGVSHFVLTDTPLLLGIMIGLAALPGILEEGTWRNYAFSGLVIGLTMSIKYSAGALVVPAVAAHTIRIIKSGNDLRRIVLNGKLLLAFSALLAGFLAGCPFSIIDHELFVADIVHQFSRVHELGNIGAEHSSAAFYYFGVLMQGVGAGGAALSLMGLVYAFFRPKAQTVLLLIFVFFYGSYISSWKVGIDKYLLPIVPALLILGAKLAIDIYDRFLSKMRLCIPLSALGLSAILIGPLFSAVSTDLTLMRKDTRTLAKEWIEENIPPRNKIAIDAGRFDIAKLSPPVSEVEENLYNTYINDDKKFSNKYIKTEKSILSKYHELRVKVKPAIAYRLQRIIISSDGSVDDDINIDKFIENEVKYVIVSSFAYEGYESGSFIHNHPYAAKFYHDFYQSLDERAVVVKAFNAEPDKRQGPTIKIYKLPASNEVRSSGPIG